MPQNIPRKVWLTCKVGAGMFPGEVSVSIQTFNIKDVSFFLPLDQVFLLAEDNGKILVQLIGEYSDYAIVELPAESFECTRAIRVANGLWKEIGSVTQLNVYFGHPVNTYDTPLERLLCESIQDEFPWYHIENPNQPHHQAGYQEWRKKEGGNPMEYFYQKVLKRCHAGVFLPFHDGKWGAGVWGEAMWMAERNFPVFKIEISGALGPTVASEAVHIGRMVNPVEYLSNVVHLTPQQTRARTYDKNGTKRNYFAPYDWEK